MKKCKYILAITLLFTMNGCALVPPISNNISSGSTTSSNKTSSTSSNNTSSTSSNNTSSTSSNNIHIQKPKQKNRKFRLSYFFAFIRKGIIR